MRHHAEVEARSGILVSHASADIGWAKWIAGVLRRAGHAVGLDAWQWNTGQDFVERMEQALQRRQRLLAVWTPAYFHGPYAMAELRAAFTRHARDPSAGLIVPVMVEDCAVPDLYAPLLRASLVGLGRPAAREALLTAVEPKRPARRWRWLPGRDGRPPAVTPSSGGVEEPFPGVPAMCSLPARDPRFFGRDELLAQLRDRLSGGTGQPARRLALHGMPGVGKTQLALEYAWRYSTEYQLLWWVDAGTAQTLQSGLINLASVLGVDDSGDPDETCRRVCAELPRRLGRRQWLLIFDNADDVDELIALLPSGGHQLITSRSAAWSSVATPVEVGVFTRPETLLLLRRSTAALDDATADRDAVDGLPLAVAQIAAYLDSHPTITARDYLPLLELERTRLLDAGHAVGYPHTAATITLAAGELAASSAAARQLVDLMLFLAIDVIPLSLFRHVAPLDGAPRQAAGDDLQFADAAAAVLRSALVRLVTDHNSATEQDTPAMDRGGVVAMHRLVQIVLSDQLTAEERGHLRRTVQQLVAAAHPGPPAERASWPGWRLLLPHLETTDIANAADDEPTRRLVVDACDYLTATLAYRAAARLRWSLHRHLQQTLGEDHPDTLTSAGNLANDLRGAGELAAARGLDEDTLARRRRVLGEDHPDTLTSAGNLAVALHGAGELAAARDLCRTAWQGRRRVLGARHPKTRSSGRQLDLILEQLGEPPEAQIAL